ncbi:MAG: PQQ-binding-like beta-propeller repeat protein [Bryobacteraceae bacterium]|nr:PQQ-binding-like beta-propeller repeat protein [Bryobacteraceae bacterium]
MTNGKSSTALAAFAAFALAFAPWLASPSRGQTPAQTPGMFRGDPAHTGVYAAKGPREFGGIAWKFATGGRVLSSPVFDRGVIYFGSDDHNIYAVDAETGVQKWKFETHAAVDSTPAVDSGLLFAASYDGYFYAIDAAKGTLRWKFKTEGERRFEAKGLHGAQPASQTFWDPWDMFLSSPVVGQGAVFFGSGDGNIYALDQWTGAVRWKFKTGDVVHSSPAYDAGTIYVGSWDGYLYALEAASGLEKWRFKTGDDALMHNQVGFQGSPAVANGVVFAGCRDSHMYAVDAGDGKEKWNFGTKGSWVVDSPALAGGMVLFGTSDSALFHALDAATGKPLYQVQDNFFLFSSPAVAGDTVYIGKMNGGLEALDLKTGKQLWEFQTEDSKANRDLVLKADRSKNDATLFRPSDIGGVVSVERMFNLGSVASSPLVVNGKVYFGSTDGFVYALK